MIKSQSGFKDPVRQVDTEWSSHLELLDQQVRAMPGSFVTRPGGVDPRLTGLKVMMTSNGAVGPREGDQIALYEMVALVRHRQSNKSYVAFRETMDALMARQTDPVKFPEWIMKHQVKRTELRIYIAEVVSKPLSRDDRKWIEWLPENNAGDGIFDSVAHFLLRKSVLTEEMYGSRR